MENFRIDAFVSPAGRQYNFQVNNYNITFKLQTAETVGKHPLDILQQDLIYVVQMLVRLERFQVMKPTDKPIKLLIQPGKEGKLTLEDILKNSPKND